MDKSQIQKRTKELLEKQKSQRNLHEDYRNFLNPTWIETQQKITSGSFQILEMESFFEFHFLF